MSPLLLNTNLIDRRKHFTNVISLLDRNQSDMTNLLKKMLTTDRQRNLLFYGINMYIRGGRVEQCT